MPDIESECFDCRDKFTITEGEQEFFKLKGFFLPKRCQSCRKIRKLEKERKVNTI